MTQALLDQAKRELAVDPTSPSCPPQYVRGCGFFSRLEAAYVQVVAVRQEMGLPIFAR